MDERQPLRQLSRAERMLVRLGRCPTCKHRLGSAGHDQAIISAEVPREVGLSVNMAVSTAFGRSKTGHFTDLRSRKTRYCARCRHTFVHGWIYPVGEES